MKKNALSIISFTLLVLVTAAWMFTIKPATQQFDPELWRSGGAFNRGGMVHFITYTGMLKGKTKKEVEELLGEADSSDSGDDVWVYFVITVPRCRILPCALVVTFDEKTGLTGGGLISD